MTIGTAPDDIFHNGVWFNRSGNPIGTASFVGDWASRPAASSLTAGSMILVTTPIAAGGQTISWWYSDGTNYKPLHPVIIARKTGITSGAVQVADQVIGQLGTIPAGVLSDNIFVCRFAIGRNNNTDAFGASTNLRIGTAGTVADAAVAAANLSALMPAAGGGLSMGEETWAKMTSATTSIRLGTSSLASSFNHATTSSTPLQQAVAIPDVTSNALFFSITTTMTAATTTTPQTGYMELVVMP